MKTEPEPLFNAYQTEVYMRAFEDAGGFRLPPMSPERLALASVVAEAIRRFTPSPKPTP